MKNKRQESQMFKPRYAIVKMTTPRDNNAPTEFEVLARCSNLRHTRKFLNLVIENPVFSWIRIWQNKDVLRRIIRYAGKSKTPEYALSIAYSATDNHVQWVYVTENHLASEAYWQE